MSPRTLSPARTPTCGGSTRWAWSWGITAPRTPTCGSSTPRGCSASSSRAGCDHSRGPEGQRDHDGPALRGAAPRRRPGAHRHIHRHLLRLPSRAAGRGAPGQVAVRERVRPRSAARIRSGRHTDEQACTARTGYPGCSTSRCGPTSATATRPTSASPRRKPTGSTPDSGQGPALLNPAPHLRAPSGSASADGVLPARTWRPPHASAPQWRHQYRRLPTARNQRLQHQGPAGAATDQEKRQGVQARAARLALPASRRRCGSG